MRNIVGPADLPDGFATEADLCAAFLLFIGDAWTAYAETAGFDILLVRKSDGVQIGVEAKLSLNVKVLTQAMPGHMSWSAATVGPEYRAVLVPYGSKSGVGPICDMLGITVISMRTAKQPYYSSPFYPSLPVETHGSADGWHQWAPEQRCPLPDYIPDVGAGHSAPVALTQWKIKAIKIAIILETRPVRRSDFKAIGISPSRWTDPWTGWLAATSEGYIAGPSIPDFKGQHPRNYEEIKADSAKWMPSAAVVASRQEAML